MPEFTWITVAQPLYVARTGVARSLLRQGPNKTQDEWQETRENAESGLEHFCEPVRVYALGTNEDVRPGYGHAGGKPAYLAANGVHYDGGQPDDEVLMAGDDPDALERDTRQWVSDWVERAKKRLAQLSTD